MVKERVGKMGFVLRACLVVIEKKMGIWAEVEVEVEEK